MLVADCVYSVPVLSDNGKIVYMSEGGSCFKETRPTAKLRDGCLGVFYH